MNTLRIFKILAVALVMITAQGCSKKKGAAAGGAAASSAPSLTATLADIVITVPAVSSYLSNDTSLTISGTCITDDTVILSGDSSSSTTCVAGAFTFVLSGYQKEV